MNDEHYIEVLGESHYVETAREFPARITATVSLLLEESASIADRAADLGRRVADILAKHREGLRRVTDDERRIATEAATRSRTFRTFRREYGLVAASQSRLDALADELARIPLDEAETVSFSSDQPEFQAEAKAVEDAYAGAIADARRTAERSLRPQDLRPGEILQARQLALRQGASGAFDDSDWWGDAERFAPRMHYGSAGAVFDERELTVFVRFLVRFAIEPM